MAPKVRNTLSNNRKIQNKGWREADIIRNNRFYIELINKTYVGFKFNDIGDCLIHQFDEGNQKDVLACPLCFRYGKISNEKEIRSYNLNVVKGRFAFKISMLRHLNKHTKLLDGKNLDKGKLS